MTNSANDQKLTAGVLGVGTISSAVIQGLLNAGFFDTTKFKKLFLSNRTLTKAQALETMFKNKSGACEVIIEGDAQNIVTDADLLFVGLHHKSIASVMQDLQFNPKTLLIVLTAATDVDSVYEMTGQVIRKEQIVRVNTLPGAKFNKGTALVYPPNAEVKSIFEKLGHVMEVDSYSEFEAALVPSCFMGDFYKRLSLLTAFLVESGIDSKQAAQFLAKLFETMLYDATQRPDEEGIFEKLVEEQTPGGLNESVIKQLEENGAYESFKKAIAGFK